MLAITAVIAFAIAAVGGAFMAIEHFRGEAIPDFVALLHGIFAASGLCLLAVVVIRSETFGLVGIALVAFLIAAVGGFVLLSFHLRRRRHPGGLVVVHGLVALVAFGILVASLL